MDLDPYEQWLLEMVVTLRYPIDVLGVADLDVHLNRPGHGFGAAEVASRLFRLQQAGLIAMIGDDERARTLSIAELTELIEGGRDAWGFAEDWSEARGDRVDVYFHLTEAGGAAWESFASPDWDRYVEDCETEGELSITSPVRERAEAVLQWLLGDDPAELTWESVAPWQATYWKQLPSAIRCRVPGGYCAGTSQPGRELDRRWFRRVVLPR